MLENQCTYTNLILYFLTIPLNRILKISLHIWKNGTLILIMLYHPWLSFEVQEFWLKMRLSYLRKVVQMMSSRIPGRLLWKLNTEFQLEEMENELDLKNRIIKILLMEMDTAVKNYAVLVIFYNYILLIIRNIKWSD